MIILHIKYRIGLFFYLIASCCFGSTNVTQEHSTNDKTLYFYTEIAPPYFSLDSNDQPQGATLDLAQALMAETGLKGKVQHLPWARAYFEAENNPNIVLLTALRTLQREEQLQWLGTVHNAQAHLISLKSNLNLQVENLEDAKAYRVGTIRGYGSANYLLNNGFTEGENLELLASQKQLWSMLFRGRIDMVLDNLATGRYEVLKAGFNSEDIKSLTNIQALNANLEMATGPATDKQTTELLRSGLAQLKANGVYQQIMKKWDLVD